MLGWLAAYKYVFPAPQVGMAFVWVCVRNKPEKLTQLLLSSSLDESKNSATTKSANSVTNTMKDFWKIEHPTLIWLSCFILFIMWYCGWILANWLIFLKTIWFLVFLVIATFGKLLLHGSSWSVNPIIQYSVVTLTYMLLVGMTSSMFQCYLPCYF